MKQALVIIIAILLLSFTTSNEVSETTKQKMFCKAFENTFSRSREYVVYKVKNSKTGEIKDICTPTNFLLGALSRGNTGHKLTIGIDCEKFHDRFFVFKDDSALRDVGFNEYSESELNAVAKRFNIDSITLQIKLGKMRQVTSKSTELKYLAHLLFNRGVITTSGCFGTSVSYFKE